jgi:hypothetical protein
MLDIYKKESFNLSELPYTKSKVHKAILKITTMNRFVEFDLSGMSVSPFGIA